MGRPVVIALLAVAGVGLSHASAEGSRTRSTGFVAPRLPVISRQTQPGSLSRGGETATSSLRMSSQQDEKKQSGFMGMLKNVANGAKTLGVAALLSLNFATAPPAEAQDASGAKSEIENNAGDMDVMKLAAADENDFSVEIKIKGLPKPEEVPSKVGNFLGGVAKVRYPPLLSH